MMDQICTAQMKNPCQLLIDDVVNLLTEFDVVIDIDDGVGEYLDGLVGIHGLVQFLNSWGMISKDHWQTGQNKLGRGKAQQVVFDFDFESTVNAFR